MPGEETRTDRRSDLHPSAAAGNGKTTAQNVNEDPTEHSYYDVSFLKPPLWKWEIASYFFLGGVSAGSYILGRMAEQFGGKRYVPLTRWGTWLAAGTILTCAPLLVHDLGDPKRFHHMLRVWKPTSPMNLGTWVVTAHSGLMAVGAFREWQRRKGHPHVNSPIDNAMTAVADLVGIPISLLLAGYTGVLLSSTANPMWSKNPWLGPLFSASAMATGAEAIEVALHLRKRADAHEYEEHEASARALGKIDTLAHVAEAICLVGYLKHAGKLAEPLTRGSMKKHLWGSVIGIAASEVIRRLPLKGKTKTMARAVSAVVGLAAGFSLRWAFVYGGHESAKDPRAARHVTRGRFDKRHKFPNRAIAKLGSGKIGTEEDSSST